MDDSIEIISDTSSSDKTIVVENDEIDNILKKYSTGNFTVPSSNNKLPNKNDLNSEKFTDKNNVNLPISSKETIRSTKNIYNLDEFSDDEFNYEPLEARVKTWKHENNSKTVDKTSSWQEKFSVEDFCEYSNDFDAVLNRISQLEAEQFQDRPRPEVSKEIETLISGNIIEIPKVKELPPKHPSFRWSGSSQEEKSNSSELHKLNAGIQSLKSAYSSTESNSEDILVEQPETKKLKRIPSSEKQAIQITKEMVKAAKTKEREQKKLDKENQKQLKNALRVVENCIKPDQCIQYIIVNIDENISNKHYGEVIKAGLSNGGYNYKVSRQLAPNVISWTRKVPTIDNMLLQNVFQQEKYYLLVVEIQEFIRRIVEKTLVGHVQSLLSMREVQHLSIAILGLQRYYKYLREEKNKGFKANNVEFRDLPKTSKKDIELELIELQISCKNIYVRPVEKYEDLVVFVGECTKSVAQIPYKTAKSESLHQETEFFTVNNRDCVRVDKDGNGLGRLWNQFLRMFPLASLETAEAVSSVYPTIHSLMEAYKNCETPGDAEKLLQDLPVRRAAGPLGGQRRIGPEFSKKAYKFFCSEENILL